MSVHDGGALVEAPTFEGWDHALSGKVRELYVPHGSTLESASEVLVVATDRISAFDHALTPGIPDKGRILTALSLVWFEHLEGVTENHVLSASDVPDSVRGRALRCEALDMVPLECVVRGYLTGSGLADYRRDGAVGGHALPDGLVDGSRLPSALFTPSTKAEQGEHDENITVEEARIRLGSELVDELEERAVAVYRSAERFARERGIILADTKLEFGRSRHTRNIVLGDEVLTPDSSRFWAADQYEPGRAQPSFDKQFVRDWLTYGSGWDKKSQVAPPPLPDAVVESTRAKYIEAYERLTGERF
ncbi:phosphoribosylaminoimidazolesuccinocarboxamide synthase [Dermabacter sp. p3-SID358]|uniref:phosphoribosylaminoimidazolesuccinocarboxamide synthase n=1 Tax=Dermabacter sp. p3-SID358 TaxID=2916114 RepID=UPI0021A94EC3|nr:phosphoribosylaminoimidazolesuccinocarboxamide synthase [Dermabacter sp. p3-SID358]MCT1866995.1 phosphoribosylaminoimidazolesuccinocarboxamide synthase [Dermabacter sp. p3-SID358]